MKKQMIRKHVKIENLVKGFKNDEEEGAYALDGNLNVRPPYQREWRYRDKLEWKKFAVIETILEDIQDESPSSLGLFLWGTNEDGTFEQWDGQQRTISICEFVTNQFAIPDKSGEKQLFDGLSPEIQEKFLNYEIEVSIFLDNNEDNRLRQIRKRNTSGEVMNEQEVRNAAYTGPWITDMRRRFAKTGCPAFKLYGKYMAGTPIQQDYLATILDWRTSDGK